tara:strand:- start:4331 stop:4672 length:342 start_codon:yes stop_codon:yes gene_type:complete
MTKATGTGNIKKPSELSMDYLQKEIIKSNAKIKELELKLDAIPKTYSVEHFTDRLKFFETRFEWWQESKETEKIIYNHLKNPVYELMDMVKLIKNYLTRETDFNVSKEKERGK